MPTLTPSIFKANDIRGIYPSQIDESVARRIGYALDSMLPPGAVVVGCDARESSSSLAAAVCSGIREAVYIGQCTTPMLYFAVNELVAAGGVMVTASHNPKEYNGFKLVKAGAVPLVGDELTHIRDMASDDLAADLWSDPILENMSGRYSEFFAKRFHFDFDHPLTIDTGNSSVGPVVRDVLNRLGISCNELCFEPDGTFPNHDPNPLIEDNLRHLKDNMDIGSIGIAFDGDGDRVCFIDENGRTVRGDLLTVLIACKLLRENGPNIILYDLRSSKIVPEIIAECGGKPIRTRVGHAFIKQEMAKHGALFGGELSYHFYFRDFFNCESGILAMLHILELLSETGERLADLVDPLNKYAHSGEINFEVRDTAETIAFLMDEFSGCDVSQMDGLSVEFGDWWFNVRGSNTEPLLRLNVEAKTDELLQEKVAMLTGLIRHAH